MFMSLTQAFIYFRVPDHYVYLDPEVYMNLNSKQINVICNSRHYDPITIVKHVKNALINLHE